MAWPLPSWRMADSPGYADPFLPQGGIRFGMQFVAVRLDPSNRSELLSAQHPLSRAGLGQDMACAPPVTTLPAAMVGRMVRASPDSCHLKVCSQGLASG